MPGPSRGTIEVNQAAALQDTIQDGSCEVLVVQHLSPFTEWLVGGKDHGPFSQVAIINDMKQDVGSVLSIGQIANFVHDQNMRMGVGQKRFLQVSCLAGIGKILDQFRSRGAERLKAILDGTVANG